MPDLAQPVPAKKEESDEGRLEEERHQPFDRERCAEDVANVVRVIRPVGAELKFQREPGGHPHHEVDPEELPPEFRHVTIDLLAGHDVDRFHDDENPRQAERQRDEQEVIQRRDGELQPREVDELSGGHRFPRPAEAGT